MAEYGRGAKAGVVAGLVCGVILAIGYYALFTLVQDTVRQAIQDALPVGSVITVDQALAAALVLLVVGTFVGTIVVGAILGLVFAAAHNKYMQSKSLAMRGIVFGVILWIIGILSNIGSFSYGATYIGLSVLIGLIASLVYGYLLGTFFGRFGPKQQVPSPTAM
ncbi:hypothetical protein AUG19_07000 [archaeon 13_1_20CM_2_54_9]|nr:MAG: hypothetical protein AUJ07_07850 [Crenarchaeota archaeon 13_1_40CM_3_53_5]OLE74989.1 MAG: hypothetical protein AUG19_07000 [archaeon 13_1_20CM_2_54_9]